MTRRVAVIPGEDAAPEAMAQGRYPGGVTVGMAVSAVGRSSFTQCAAMFQGEACLAVCEAVTVYAVHGAARALPDERAALVKLSFAG